MSCSKLFVQPSSSCIYGKHCYSRRSSIRVRLRRRFPLFVIPEIVMPARFCLLGFILSLVLIAPAFGQLCNANLEADGQPISTDGYVALTDHHVAAKNNTLGRFTTLEQFFCKAAGKTIMAEPLLSTSTQAWFRMEFSVWENEAWLPAAADQYEYDENKYEFVS